jgi:ParB/RepB/Spo0J family partition protein
MEVKEIPIAEIDISQFNTRKDLTAGTEDTSLDELASSIKEKGLLSPITVLQSKNGKFDLIAGQRRLLACKKIGMSTIPAIIRDDLSDTDATILSLVENVHRADMNPLDKARAYSTIYDKYKDYNRVAKETGVSVPTIKRYVSLLNLSESLQEKVSTSEGVAGIQTLATLAQTFSEEEQEEAYNEIGNFKQSIQVEILKRSEGNLEKLGELKERAMEGAFDVKACREGLCFDMPDELKIEIKKWLSGKQDYATFAKGVGKLEL